MYKLARPLFLHCQTPLHAGTGQDLGYIDLPIQREKHTGFPKVEASSLKGALREVFEANDAALVAPFNTSEKVNNKGNISLSFGPTDGSEHAAAIGFTDARLLLFPVKSLKGIFAWITCTSVLDKFKKELELCSETKSHKEIEDLANLIPSNVENTISDFGKLDITNDGNTSKVVLEEYAYTLSKNDELKSFATKLQEVLGISNLEKRLIVLKDDEFTDFVKLHTEVISRIVINDETGTTDNLFNEEFLPAESVLYSLVLASPIFNSNKGIFEKTNGKEEYENLMEYFNQGAKDIFQLGGDATLGKGITKAIKTLL